MKIMGVARRDAPAFLFMHQRPPTGSSLASDSSLDFELRAWTESGDAMTIVRSDLAVGIQDALAAANIEVPFPQRDLHVKTVPT
jgi:small-conductance mechanosensitive channel